MTLQLALMLALTIKHFVCDFPLQAHTWLYSHKGEYGHPGGVAHACIHMAGTSLCLRMILGWGMMAPDGSPGHYAVIVIPVIEGYIHYHIDWAKMAIGARFGLKPNNSELFWILLGFDQLLHGLTYIAIVWWLT